MLLYFTNQKKKKCFSFKVSDALLFMRCSPFAIIQKKSQTQRNNERKEWKQNMVNDLSRVSRHGARKFSRFSFAFPSFS